METIIQTIADYGGDPSAVVRFDEPRPELLPYATLVSARDAGLPDFSPLAGVYEWQRRPLLLLVDGQHLRDDGQHVRHLRRAAAMRGDAPYLGVVHPGRLTVYQIGWMTVDQKQRDWHYPLPPRNTGPLSLISEMPGRMWLGGTGSTMSYSGFSLPLSTR